MLPFRNAVRVRNGVFESSSDKMMFVFWNDVVFRKDVRAPEPRPFQNMKTLYALSGTRTSFRNTNIIREHEHPPWPE